jgi:hypothetical protein
MVSDEQADDKKSGTFWTSLPGILTGIAAVGTAVAGIIGTLTNADFFRPSSSPSGVMSGAPAVQAPAQQGDPSAAAINSPPKGPEPTPVTSTSTYPRDLKITASTTAGDYTFKVLSARLEEYGQDPTSQTKTLLLRLRIRETFHAKDRGSGYFMSDGYRLHIDEVVKAPKETPNQLVAPGTSEDGEVTFLVPETAKQVTLIVGYYDNHRSKIPLTLFPTPGG